MDLTLQGYRYKDLVKILQKIEWQGDVATIKAAPVKEDGKPDLEDKKLKCPMCGSPKNVGHEADCKLAAEFGVLRHGKGVRMKGTYKEPKAAPVIL